MGPVEDALWTRLSLICRRDENETVYEQVARFQQRQDGLS